MPPRAWNGAAWPPCSRIVAEELTGRPFHYAMLSGPSFAAEVVRDQPTAVVLATAEEALGCRLRELSCATFRCYSSTECWAWSWAAR